MTATQVALTIPGLETAYDALASAIDQAGADKTELFLVKLALLNANAMGHPGAVPAAPAGRLAGFVSNPDGTARGLLRDTTTPTLALDRKRPTGSPSVGKEIA
jgi:hypothetical protein